MRVYGAKPMEYELLCFLQEREKKCILSLKIQKYNFEFQNSCLVQGNEHYYYIIFIIYLIKR